MTLTGGARVVTYFVFVACAIALSALLVREAIRVAGSSDAEIVAAFYGAAYEDVFGFGFWVTWLLFAGAESLFLLGAWVLWRARGPRSVVAVVLVAFLLSSALGYRAFSREQALWFSGQNHSQLQANYSFKRTAVTGAAAIMRYAAAAA